MLGITCWQLMQPIVQNSTINTWPRRLSHANGFLPGVFSQIALSTTGAAGPSGRSDLGATTASTVGFGSTGAAAAGAETAGAAALSDIAFSAGAAAADITASGSGTGAGAAARGAQAAKPHAALPTINFNQFRRVKRDVFISVSVAQKPYIGITTNTQFVVRFSGLRDQRLSQLY